MNNFKIDNPNNGTNKISLDKYYTSDNLAQKCINITMRVLKDNEITEVIEPSAGNGVFSNKIKNCIAYDISPENDSIIQQDFLELNIPYKKGRLIIGNPPFGTFRNDMVFKFFLKSIKISDFIAFILPINKLNNISMLFHFDLIYSEDLGINYFSGKEIHTCLNIYKRPVSGKYNKKKKNKLNDITIIRKSYKSFANTINYDIRIMQWGGSSRNKPGKILKDNEHYANELKIIINNKELKEKIINFFETVNWELEIIHPPQIKSLQIKIYDVIRVIKKYIPEIK